jgi:hypothetical protein
MDIAFLVALASTFLTVASVFLGMRYRQGLKKARLFAKLLEEIITAAEDDKISEKELKQVIATAKEIVEEQ